MSNSAWAHGSTPTLASKIDALTFQAAEQLKSKTASKCRDCQKPIPTGLICNTCLEQRR